MLVKVRRAKGERRCWFNAARRRDMMGVCVRIVAVGVCIGGCGELCFFVVGVGLAGTEEEGMPILRLDTISRDDDDTNWKVVEAQRCDSGYARLLAP